MSQEFEFKLKKEMPTTGGSSDAGDFDINGTLDKRLPAMNDGIDYFDDIYTERSEGEGVELYSGEVADSYNIYVTKGNDSGSSQLVHIKMRNPSDLGPQPTLGTEHFSTFGTVDPLVPNWGRLQGDIVIIDYNWAEGREQPPGTPNEYKYSEWQFATSPSHLKIVTAPSHNAGLFFFQIRGVTKIDEVSWTGTGGIGWDFVVDAWLDDDWEIVPGGDTGSLKGSGRYNITAAPGATKVQFTFFRGFGGSPKVDIDFIIFS